MVICIFNPVISIRLVLKLQSFRCALPKKTFFQNHLLRLVIRLGNNLQGDKILEILFKFTQMPAQRPS